LKILIGIAKALCHIHDQCGWSHRDMKPHNVMLGGRDGTEPLLTDFGSVSVARVEITTRSQALSLEEEAAEKTSAAYRYCELKRA
jgi:serine/threonine kinase 16